MENWDWECNEAPKNPIENFNWPIPLSECLQIYGAGWDTPKERVGGGACQATFQQG